MTEDNPDVSLAQVLRARSGGVDDDVPVSFASVHDLRGWLASKDIPVHRWGTGQAKRVEDLWSELRTGESVLTDLPPRRGVAFVSVVVRRQGTQSSAGGPAARHRRDQDAAAATQRENAPRRRREDGSLPLHPGRTGSPARVVPDHPGHPHRSQPDGRVTVLSRPGDPVPDEPGRDGDPGPPTPRSAPRKATEAKRPPSGSTTGTGAPTRCELAPVSRTPHWWLASAALLRWSIADGGRLVR